MPKLKFEICSDALAQEKYDHYNDYELTLDDIFEGTFEGLLDYLKTCKAINDSTMVVFDPHDLKF